MNNLIRLGLIFGLFCFQSGYCQFLSEKADSIRLKYKIPGLVYAVVKKDAILDMNTLGLTRKDGSPITKNSLFAFGSCSKAVTSLVASDLVSKGVLTYETKFFDLFPEFKQSSDTSYLHITLLNLLSHRAHIQPLTGQNNEKLPEKLLNDTSIDCRYNLAKWVFGQKRFDEGKAYHYSNGGYTLVGLMLEKVTGKSWERLVSDFMTSKGIKVSFEYPNVKNPNDVWFHTDKLRPVKPSKNFESGCNKPIAPGGLVFMSIVDASKYLQLQLNGLFDLSDPVRQMSFEFMHYGLPEYSLGWVWAENEGNRFSAHQGNIAGWSFCDIRIYAKQQLGIIVMANAGNNDAMTGVIELRRKLFNYYK